MLKYTGNGTVITVSEGASLSLYDCYECGEEDDETDEHHHDYKKVSQGVSGAEQYTFVWYDFTDITENDGTVHGGVIIGGANSKKCGGIHVEGVFTMYGGTVSGNKITNENDTKGGTGGGGVSLHDNSVFTMYNGAITRNSTYWMGAGVLMEHNSSFTMYNGTISENKAYIGSYSSSYGGGVFVRTFGTGMFTLYDG